VKSGDLWLKVKFIVIFDVQMDLEEVRMHIHRCSELVNKCIKKKTIFFSLVRLLKRIDIKKKEKNSKSFPLNYLTPEKW
jgi:hypothetical protein